jgi:hypothetical protein
MVQLSATRCSCIAILWVSLVSFAAVTLCVASQRVFVVVYFVIDSVREFLDVPPYCIIKTQSLTILLGFLPHRRVQTGPGAQSASYPMGTGVSFPRGKAAGREADHSPPYSAEAKNTWGAIPPLHHTSSWCSTWLSTGTTLPALRAL